MRYPFGVRNTTTTLVLCQTSLQALGLCRAITFAPRPEFFYLIMSMSGPEIANGNGNVAYRTVRKPMATLSALFMGAI